MLPDDFSNETYWKDIYPRPLSYWQPGLDRITRRHFQQTLVWQRAELGRNVVFVGEEIVIKLSPPAWVDQLERETHALAWVAGRLPVQTPQLLHGGSIDRWGYLIQRRLPGRNLHELWKNLDAEQREPLARRHGEILAALHGLEQPGPSAQAGLAFDWNAMLAEQRLACAEEMLKAGVRPSLAAQVDFYLDGAEVDWQDQSGYVVLHGDLTHLNFLVEPAPSGWQITGLMDWGDARLGPPGHEFISPGVHMYLGDRRSLTTFYQGCGQALQAVGYPVEIMARAMLYYADSFASILGRIPQSSACQDWAAIADIMW